jgi:hypothetical protein
MMVRTFDDTGERKHRGIRNNEVADGTVDSEMGKQGKNN